MRPFSSSVLFAVAFSVASYATSPLLEAPAYWPTCANPQNIGPMQPVGGTRLNYTRTAVVWNGQDYALAWVDGVDQNLHFRRFFADGTPVAAIQTPGTGLAYPFYPPSLVWNGSGYGVAWTAHNGTSYQVYFARLDVAGARIGAAVKASFVGLPETPGSLSFGVSLAYSGDGYAVAWADDRDGTQNVYATVLNASGAVTFSDVLLCGAAGHQLDPSLAWSKGAGRYQAVWKDDRSGSDLLYGNSMTIWGVVGGETLLTPAGLYSARPSLMDTGASLGLSYHDSRSGDFEIYFARLTSQGYKVGPDVRLTTSAGISVASQLLWTGVEYAVLWEDDRGGNYDLYFQRVSSAGVAVGANTQVTATSGMEYTAGAFGRYGFMITGCPDYANPNYLLPWGCAADVTPPTCPMNLVAYNITGTTATVAWVPSVEDATDLAYYEVYRNSALVAKTSDTLYADSGLSLSGSYNYYVRPVNAAQLVNGACTSSIYIKTNASLLLMVNKAGNGSDVDLVWTDAQMNNYNIFRSTDPRVMNQIGATAGQAYTDPNALMNSNLYFYTVDEPGQ